MKIIKIAKSLYKNFKNENLKIQKEEIKEKSNNLITDAIYKKYQCEKMNKKELEELINQLKIQKTKHSQMSKWYINVVCEKTGWSYKKSQEEMNKALKKGYSFRQYITKAIYLKNGELENAPKQIFSSNCYYNKEKIIKEMKWSERKYLLELLKARNNCGCNSKEFYILGLYKMKPEEQKKYITMESHLQMQIRYTDFANSYECFKNKIKFNETFNKFVSRKWFKSNELKYEDFLKKTKEITNIIYKPISLSSGKGIVKFDLKKKNKKEIYEYIIHNDEAIIEEFINQHKFMSDIYPNSVNTIRVMSLVKNGKCHILNSAIRIGKTKYVDNFSAGGILAGINVDTGIVETNGVDGEGNIFSNHPTTNHKIKGIQIPYWDKIKKTVKEASMIVKDSPYVGWDICILKNGDIELIEGNHDQYATMIQYPYAIDLNKGIKYTIEPYIEFNKN